MIQFYGIPNCDTVKKARAWLDARGIEYTFHDYKKEGADPAKLAAWSDAVGLGSAAQPPRHHLPRAARRRQGGHRPGQGDPPDGRPTPR